MRSLGNIPRTAAVICAALAVSLGATVPGAGAATKTSSKKTTAAKCDPGSGTILAANRYVVVYSATSKHQKHYYACRVGRARGAAFANEILLPGDITDVEVAGYYMAYSVAGCPKSDDPHCAGFTAVRNVRTGKRVLQSSYRNAPSQDDALVLTTRGAAAWVRSSIGSDGKATYAVLRSTGSGQASTLDAGPSIAPELALSTFGGDIGSTPTSRVPTLVWKNGDALRSAPLR